VNVIELFEQFVHLPQRFDDGLLNRLEVLEETGSLH
jgi:hypothetical protein